MCDVSVISKDKKFRVDWVDLGEGVYGEYDENNPNDKHLLRFDVYVKGGVEVWTPLDDASYCTLMEAGTPRSILISTAKHIAEAYAECSGSYKRLGEQLSWVSADGFNFPLTTEV